MKNGVETWISTPFKRVKLTPLMATNQSIIIRPIVASVTTYRLTFFNRFDAPFG